MNLLEVKNISKSYADHQALSDVSLHIPEKSIFGLLGPNGAGKTTLIRIITQILQADQGTITLNGQTLEPSHIRAIGYLPEERGLYKKMMVGEQLLYLAQLKGLNRKEATQKIKYWLDRLDMKSWSQKNIEDLSKGMQQKIQFIATVLHDPKLIILDEPFSGFDPINANLIKDEILNLREQGATIIFSTHRMESVEELCDHIALINKSRKILDGLKKDIKHDYRTQTYEVEHIGSFSLPQGNYQLLENQPKEDNYYYSRIQIMDQSNPNELLKGLLSQAEIHKFAEVIPSMNDIFIAKVQSES